MLEIRNAYKTFNPGTPNEVRALQGVDLRIEDGDFVVVIGGNGSGKSTLLNAIAGVFRLDKGEMLLGGRRVTKWPDYRRARLVGRVFQNPFQGTAPNMTLAENLAMAALRGRPRGLGWALPKRLREEMRERVRPLGMGLEDRLDNVVGSLSGGQRQALTLLMATWRKPEILLLDEHTAALDPKSADMVIRLTREVVERERQTTLMVTHSMQQASRLGDRLVMLHRGKVIRDFRGARKARLRGGDLLAIFEDVRRRERLDPAAAETLRATYV